MDEKNKNVIVEKTFSFALAIVELAEELECKRKFVIGNQILRSGTSIGANIREAQNAQSAKDFLHKVKIAAKEAEETEYWLLICQHSKNYPDVKALIESLLEIKKILTSIIYTTNKNLKTTSA
jgi:four helix bundle protein